MTGTGSASNPRLELRRLSAADTELGKVVSVVAGVAITSAATLRPVGSWPPFSSGAEIAEELRELVARANVGRLPGS